MKSSQEIRKSFDEIRTIADEIRVKVHLATLDARSYWERLEPQLKQLERAVQDKGTEALTATSQLLDDVGVAVRKLRDQLANPTSDRD